MSSHWPISILSTLSSLVNMLLPLVLVRILGPEDIGLFKIFFLYLTIFPAFSMTTGLFNGISYWVGQKEDSSSAIQMSSMMILVSAVLFFAVAWGFQGQLAAFWGWPAPYAMIFCLGLFGSMASSFYEETAIAMGKIWSGALFSSVLDLIRTAGILVAAILTRSLMAIFVTHVALHLLKTALGYWLGYRQGMVGFAWNQRVFKDVWRFAFPVSVAWAFGVVVSYSDQMILSKFVAPADFAFYSIGCLSIPPLLILEISVTRVLIPQLSAAFSRGDAAGASRLFRKAVGELSYLIIPAVVGLIVFSRPIIELLFTEKYSGAAGYLRLYAFFYLALLIPNDSVPRARGEGKWLLWNFVCFSVFTLAICWVLTQYFGPYGALVGLLVSKAAMRAYAIYYIRETTSWKLSEFLPLSEMSRSTIVCLGLAALCWMMRPVLGSGLTWFLVGGGIFSVLYFALTMAWSHRIEQGQANDRKVLMLTQHLGIGGLERMILNLSVTLKEQGQWLPHIFVYDHADGQSPENHLVGAFEAEGIPVRTFTKPSGFSLQAVARIARYVLVEKIQVIHSHDLGALIYGVGAKVATMGRVRLVHTQHSFVHMQRKKRYRHYERLFTWFADELTVVSQDTAKTYLELGVPERKIHVVANGVAFACAGDRAGKKDIRSKLLPQHAEAQWVLYLARVHGRKGQDHAIALWNGLSAETRRASVLLFVGPETQAGELARVQALAAQALDSDRIVWAGPTSTPHLWLEASDVFLSCSEFEGMPLGPVEGAGAGLPLVLSRIAGHEMFEEMSRQYPLSEPSKGSAAIEAALRATSQTDVERLHRYSVAVRERYSISTMARRYAGLYARPSRRAALPSREAVAG